MLLKPWLLLKPLCPLHKTPENGNEEKLVSFAWAFLHELKNFEARPWEAGIVNL